MYWLWYLLIGLVAGWLANLIVRGSGSGLIVNLIVGIIGGFLARRAYGLDTYGDLRHAYSLGGGSYRSAAHRIALHAPQTLKPVAEQGYRVCQIFQADFFISAEAKSATRCSLEA